MERKNVQLTHIVTRFKSSTHYREGSILFASFSPEKTVSSRAFKCVLAKEPAGRIQKQPMRLSYSGKTRLLCDPSPSAWSQQPANEPYTQTAIIFIKTTLKNSSLSNRQAPAECSRYSDCNMGSNPPQGRLFSSPKRSNRVWGPPNLQFKGYRDSFPELKETGEWCWTSVATHLLPSIYLHGVERGNLTFTFIKVRQYDYVTWEMHFRIYKILFEYYSNG